MATDEERRKRIKKQIEDKKDKRDKKKDKIKKYEKENEQLSKEIAKFEEENKKLEEDVKNYELLIASDKSAQGFLGQAHSSASAARNSYKKNLQGNTGKAKVQAADNLCTQILKIRTDLGPICESAKIAKKVCEMKITQNKKEIQTRNAKISDNRKFISELSRDVRHLENEIDDLRDKL